MVSESVFERDYFWMQKAITLAKKAGEQKEIPVGAILIADNEIIGEGFNTSILDCDPTSHAEIISLRQGGQTLKNYRLINTTLYVTLEPCLMCLGAMIHARIKRLVFGAYDSKSGAVNNIIKLIEPNKLNHRIDFEGGVLADECGEILKVFFSERRKLKG